LAPERAVVVGCSEKKRLTVSGLFARKIGESDEPRVTNSERNCGSAVLDFSGSLWRAISEPNFAEAVINEIIETKAIKKTSHLRSTVLLSLL
jgi:hypothetical protein